MPNKARKMPQGRPIDALHELHQEANQLHFDLCHFQVISACQRQAHRRRQATLWILSAIARLALYQLYIDGL
jgi:Leu/Phe-tRNA-protein transferase